MPFKPGQSGNPSGRPKHQQKYLKSLVRLVKHDDWQCIVLKAIEQARRGDKSARQFLADYCLGKPAQQIDIGEDNKVVIEVVHVKDADLPS
jgi:hypothetical protein